MSQSKTPVLTVANYQTIIEKETGEIQLLNSEEIKIVGKRGVIELPIAYATAIVPPFHALLIYGNTDVLYDHKILILNEVKFVDTNLGPFPLTLQAISFNHNETVVIPGGTLLARLVFVETKTREVTTRVVKKPPPTFVLDEGEENVRKVSFALNVDSFSESENSDENFDDTFDDTDRAEVSRLLSKSEDESLQAKEAELRRKGFDIPDYACAILRSQSR